MNQSKGYNQPSTKMQRKQITIIGTGLIGGSLALQLNEKGLAANIIGVDSNKQHAEKALEMGLIDEVMELHDAIQKSEVIILAVPVDGILNLLPEILNNVKDQVVIDLGSTKSLSLILLRIIQKEEDMFRLIPCGVRNSVDQKLR